ncbi:Wzz/FepE/Etk N-terminal domain-containing protein [Enterovibrio nigricans]|uniref:Wzz/FepE/Etk N-terminal domain-containing protein n=1 Tax=Enterovibrio nigricans TaxID=504469 RepID=UPI001FCD65C2|nr:Wzz/FepE/Etk N-terminal domain-containing protein [Enterovibrio nigricans]
MKIIEPNQVNETPRIDFKRFVNVLGRYWFPIALFVVLVTAVATLFVLSIQPVYRATATLLIESSTNKTVSIEEVYALDTNKKILPNAIRNSSLFAYRRKRHRRTGTGEPARI